MSKASVLLAQENMRANNVDNVRVARLSAEDFVEAYEGTRYFRRLDDGGILIGQHDNRKETKSEEGKKEGKDGSGGGGAGGGGGGGGGDGDGGGGAEAKVPSAIPAISAMRFDRLSTLFVDPPRAGLDETCRRLAATFDRIVYVSCNPETLARDLAELSTTHRPTRVAAFDQFPYTPHLEAGVVLERREE